MTARLISAAFLGFVVGDLPDDGLVWSVVKLGFVIAMVALYVRIGRREGRS